VNGSPQPQTRDQASGFTELELRESAGRGAAELDGASATELLGWTDEIVGADGYLVTSNMEDAAVQLAYDIRLLNVAPEHTVAEQDATLEKDLWARDPDECCRHVDRPRLLHGEAGAGHRPADVGRDIPRPDAGCTSRMR
jgi:hypothetical protein